MEIDKSSPQGNAFYILGAVSKLLKDVGREDEIPDVMKRMKSGDYENLCKVAEEVTHGSIKVVEAEN